MFLAGFLSRTLLVRHERFEGCPTFAFEQSREGFRSFVDCIRTYVPLEQAVILPERFRIVAGDLVWLAEQTSERGNGKRADLPLRYESVSYFH